MVPKYLILILILFASSRELTSQEKKAPKDAVLNFDSDLIEGIKHKPDLFLQNNVQELSLDSIIYLRKDFNDFHAVDSKRRPRHVRQLVPK